MRRVVRFLVGFFATLCLGIGLLLQSVLHFVDSADSTAQTVESVLSDPSLRNLISEKIVEEIEAENSNPTQRLLFVVVRQSLLHFVSEKIQEPVAVELVSDVVRGAYRVYVDGEDVVSIDLSRFAEFSTEAITEIDARLSTDFGDQFSSFEIERPRDSQKFGTFLTLTKVAAWALMIIGTSLLALLWRSVRPNRVNQFRIVAVVLLATGVVVGAVVILLRVIAPQFSSEYSSVIRVLTDFVTSPALQRAFICVGIAVAASAVSLVVSKRENAQ